MGGKWGLSLVACLGLAGCGGDPENDRLATGDAVIAFEHKHSDGGRYDRVIVEGTGDSLWPMLPYGTHLSVVKDEEGLDEKRTWSTRQVLIHVEDGEHKGKTGTVTRWSLRKVK